MKTIYYLIGAIGIIGSVIILGMALSQKLYVLIPVSIVEFFSCTIFFTVSSLMDHADDTDERLEEIETILKKSHLYDEYIDKKIDIVLDDKKCNDNADYEKISVVIDLFKQKKYDEAINTINNLVEKGNKDAYAYLGYCYMRGYGIEKNTNKGIEWYKKSSDAGNATGKMFLGISYYEGYGVECNKELGKKLLYESAKQGNEKAKEYIKSKKII